MCPGCGKPVAECICRDVQADTIPAGDGIVRVSRETKGRKGKGVTLVAGIPVSASELRSLAKQLKRRCGAGGTVKDRVIEIQGDHRDLLVDVVMFGVVDRSDQEAEVQGQGEDDEERKDDFLEIHVLIEVEFLGSQKMLLLAYRINCHYKA